MAHLFFLKTKSHCDMNQVAFSSAIRVSDCEVIIRMYCHAKPERSTRLLFKWAVTASWLCGWLLLISGCSTWCTWLPEGHTVIMVWLIWQLLIILPLTGCLLILYPPVPHIYGFSFFISKKVPPLNMLKIKCDINQQYLKRVDHHCVKSEYFSLTWSCGSRQWDTTSSV